MFKTWSFAETMAKKVEGLGNHYQCLSQGRRTQKLLLFCQWQKLMQLSLVPCFFCHLVFQHGRKSCRHIPREKWTMEQWGHWYLWTNRQNVVAKSKMCLKGSAHFKQVLHIPRILNIRKMHRHELQTSKGRSGRPAVQKMRSDTSNLLFLGFGLCPQHVATLNRISSFHLFSSVDPALA